MRELYQAFGLLETTIDFVVCASHFSVDSSCCQRRLSSCGADSS